MRHIAYVAIAAAAAGALFGLLFVETPNRWPMRVITIVLGLVAVTLPVVSLYETVGFPDPWLKQGQYEVVGWKFDEVRRAIYTFVKLPGEPRPRLYVVDFDTHSALELQQAREHPEHLARIGMTVTANPDGGPAVAFQFEKRVVIRSLAEQAAEEEEDRRSEEARRARQPSPQTQTPREITQAGRSAGKTGNAAESGDEDEDDKK